MYITINSLKKTLGKYVEMNDLYIGLPILFTFLIMFTCTNYKIFSLIFITIGLFMMIPVNVSKKNRMYKVLILFFYYVCKRKEYIFLGKENVNLWREKLKKKKI